MQALKTMPKSLPSQNGDMQIYIDLLSEYVDKKKVEKKQLEIKQNELGKDVDSDEYESGDMFGADGKADKKNKISAAQAESNL